MDSFYLAGIGIVTFNNEDLLITRKARKSKPRRRSRSWMS